jgi:glyceraldehyde-3-phosphate dehydrogenase/erythrose-4-phosphate dehydrogenase
MAEQTKEIRVDTTVEGVPGDIAGAALQVAFFAPEIFQNNWPFPDQGVTFNITTVSGRFGTALKENAAKWWLFRKSPEKAAIHTLIAKLANPELGIDPSRIKATDGGILIDGHPIQVVINDRAEDVPADGNALVIEATNVKDRKNGPGLSAVASNSNHGEGAKVVAVTSPAKEMRFAIRNITHPDSLAMAQPGTHPLELMSCSTQAAAQILNAFMKHAHAIGQIESASIHLPHALTPSDNPEYAHNNAYQNSSGLEKSLAKISPDLFVMADPWRIGNIPASGIGLDLTFPAPLGNSKEAVLKLVQNILEEYEIAYPGTFYFIRKGAKEGADLKHSARVPHAATLFMEDIKVHSSLRRITIGGGYDNVYGYTAQILQTLAGEFRSFADKQPQVLFPLLEKLQQQSR